MDDERKKLFHEFKSEVGKRQLSNSENYDRSILTLSSAALTLSATFVKNLVEDAAPELYVYLIASWVAFGLAIVLTLFSFLTSQWGLIRILKNAEAYYMHGNEGALDTTNGWARCNEIITVLSGLSFTVGLVFLIVFVAQNLPGVK